MPWAQAGGCLRWSTHPFGGLKCRYPFAFAPGSSKMAVGGGLVFLYIIVHNLSQLLVSLYLVAGGDVYLDCSKRSQVPACLGLSAFLEV